MWNLGLEHLATKVSVRALEAKVIRQTRFVEKFYTEYKTRRILDMIAFADQAERADFASNKLREDWVVVSGKRITIQLVLRKIRNSC